MPRDEQPPAMTAQERAFRAWMRQHGAALIREDVEWIEEMTPEPEELAEMLATARQGAFAAGWKAREGERSRPSGS